ALARMTQTGREGSISFVMARPAAEFFPVDDLKSCTNAIWKKEAPVVLQFGSSVGYGPLKEALIAMLSGEGYKISDETLLITNGCQQALDLLCRAFLRPGDTVLLENPAYPGAIAAC